jgi:hypothetical protein
MTNEMSATNLKSKGVKIRKEHRCWGCMVTFPIGTIMLYEASVDSGRVVSCYWCTDCVAILLKIDWNEYEDGLCFGDLKECPEFQEHYDNKQSKERTEG